MPFNLQGALDEGYTYSDIASHLANKNSFDLSGAQNEGYTDEEIVTYLMNKDPVVAEPVVEEPNVPVTKRTGGLMERSRAASGYDPEVEAQKTALQQVQDIGVGLAEGFKEVPISAAVGAGEGFVGLAGDIEALARGVSGAIVSEDVSAWEGFKRGISQDTFIPNTNDVADFVNKNFIDFSGSPYELLGQISAPVGQVKILSNMIKTGKPFVKYNNASKLADELDYLSDVAVTEKVPLEQVKQFVADKKGIPVEDVDVIYKTAGRKMDVYKTPEVRRVTQEANQIANEAATGNPLTKSSLISRIFEPAQTRLTKISDALGKRVSKYMFDGVYNVKKYADRATPFLTSLNKLPKNVYTKVWQNLNNANFNEVNNLLKNNPVMQKQFQETQSALQDIYKELYDVGFTKMGKVYNYYPRIIKDLDGLYEEIGIAGKTEIQKQLQKVVNKRKEKNPEFTVDDIDPIEKTNIINNYLSGRTRTGAGKPSFAQQRQINQIPENLLKHYHRPEDAMSFYINRTVKNINKKRFFGKDAVINDGNAIDISKSVGKLFESGKIPLEAEQEVRTLLDGIMNMGEVSPSKFVQKAKNLIYLGTIGNPMSAITQIGDLGASAFVNGNKTAIAQLFKTNPIKLEDIGINNIIAEISTIEGTSKLLNNVFKATGFSRMDRFGKEQFLNTSFAKARKLASTDKGVEVLRKQWGDAFGNEFDSFINDLRQGVKSDNVLYYTFHELAEVQPITLAQMPIAYLQNPNLRILYALKSFALKQLDLLKKKTVDLWNKGQKLEATKNAVAFTLIYGGLNTATDQVKNAIMGRDTIRMDEVPLAAGLNVLKMFGASQYTLDNLGAGRTAKALGDVFLPPVDILFTPFDDLMKGIDPEKESKLKTLGLLPIVGPFIRNYMQGGQERYNEQLFKERYDLD